MNNLLVALKDDEVGKIFGGKIIVSKEVFELMEGAVALASSVAFACAVYYYRLRIERKEV